MYPQADTGYLLYHVANALYGQSDQALQEQLGIGLSQLRILSLLAWQTNLTQKELSDLLGQTEASISRQVALLETKQLLQTKTDPDERRRHLVAPTAKGLKVTQAAREALTACHKPIFGSLSEKQQHQFAEILEALHAHICAVGRPRACQFLDEKLGNSA